MVAMNRSQMLKELLPGLNELFGLEYKKYENEHLDIFEVENSDRSFEEEVKLSGFGQAAVKGEGQSIQYDAAQEAYTARYVHETIAMGFAITEEAMEDNLYDKLAGRYTKAMARSMAYTKQVKAAAWLNNGFNSTTYLAPTGQYVFDTDHALVSGGTQQNRPTTAVDLNETALEAAIVTIAGWKDERGLLIAARPMKLIVPAALEWTTTRLLKSEKRVGTADNDVSAIVTNSAIPGGYSINHFLTDTDAWFLKTDLGGWKHFVRRPMKTDMSGDFDTGNARYKASERYSFGISEYLGFYGSPGA